MTGEMRQGNFRILEPGKPTKFYLVTLSTKLGVLVLTEVFHGDVRKIDKENRVPLTEELWAKLTTW